MGNFAAVRDGDKEEDKDEGERKVTVETLLLKVSE